MRRRLLNGSHFSNTPSPTISPSDFFSPPSTSDASAIPIRTNSSDNQPVDQIEQNLLRTRISRRKGFQSSRSDSADVLSLSRQYSSEQGAISD